MRLVFFAICCYKGGSLIFANANLAWNGKYWVPLGKILAKLRQNLCRYFNFCQCQCCLKWKREIIYNKLYRYFNFCHFLPTLPKMEQIWVHLSNNEAAPPPPPPPNKDVMWLYRQMLYLPLFYFTASLLATLCRSSYFVVSGSYKGGSPTSTITSTRDR